jgi:PAS domain S-box-containing protein
MEVKSNGIKRFDVITEGGAPMGQTTLLTATTAKMPPSPAQTAEKVLALALGLAHAENELQAFTSGQVDAIVDLDGRPYLLRPAQERLRQNEGRLQSVLDSGSDLIMVIDPAGLIVSQSLAVRRMLGFGQAELVGEILFNFVHEEDKRQLYFGFHNVISGLLTDATVEFRHRTRDGSYCMLEASVSKLREASVASVVLTCRDISKRKQAEEALLKAGALQRAIFNSANFSSIATDAKGVIQIFNVGAERMLGYTAAEVMNKITPADISDSQELIARATALSVELRTTITPGFEALVFKAARGIEDIYELTYIRKDGSRFPAIVSVTALRDAQDAIIGYLLIGTDNTARKRVEAEQMKLDQRLRDQQFYTRSLIESNIDALMTTDPSGIISDVNKQMEALTGCTRDELIGAPFKNYFTDPERAEVGIKRVLSEKKVTDYELTARARGGKETVVSYNATTIYDRDRKLQGVFAAARDVTERKQAEQELSEKARLLDLSNDAIIVRDLDDKISSWNKGAEKLYGWASEEAIGKHLDSLLQTEFPKPMEEILAQLQSDGEFSGEVVQIVRDGRRVAVLCRWVLDRGTKSILTSYTDITERRMLEDSLVARASDLVRADRSKDEFLAMLAHELRNPLAPLRNAVEILQTAGASADECGQAQRIIGRQIQNMTRMIDDLLDVSRITEGKIELRREPVAIADILTAAASVARSGIRARSQMLEISLPAEPIFVDGDATRLDQVFGNLLGNACKYSDAGCHIWLSAEAAPAAGSPLSAEPGDMEDRSPEGDEGRTPGPLEVVVRVRDNGIGISPELLPHIFDLFVQSTRALDRAHGGLGIGLTLVQRLVKLHGGSVEACSGGIGHGSEFIVRLPIVPGRVAAPQPPAPAPEPAAPETPRRMLIVDDNEDSARSMAMLQRRRNYETRTASTGPAAVAAAAEFAPEVVLLDIGLPGMDGFEVARRLRAMPALAGAFLVAMSGYGSEEDRTEALSAGFDEYLVKPVDLGLLRERLRSRASEASSGS